MSTLKVNTLKGTIDISAGSKIGNAFVSHNVTDSATEPSNPKNSDVWYDTTNSILKVRINDTWVELDTTAKP